MAVGADGARVVERALPDLDIEHEVPVPDNATRVAVIAQFSTSRP